MGQIESRTQELKAMQEAFFHKLQSTQREIGMLKQVVLSPAAAAASRRDILVTEVASLRAEIDTKAGAAAARVAETMAAAEDASRRIISLAQADAGRLMGERGSSIRPAPASLHPLSLACCFVQVQWLRFKPDYA